MEFTEKYTKKYVKGSTVVEMSYLIPFCLILDAFFRERTSGKLIFLENVTTRVDLSGKKIEVEVFASKGRMKIHLIQRATKVKPEEKVRWKK